MSNLKKFDLWINSFEKLGKTIPYLLEERNGVMLFRDRQEYVCNHRIYYEPIVYHVWAEETGEWIAVENYISAHEVFERMATENRNGFGSTGR